MGCQGNSGPKVQACVRHEHVSASETLTTSTSTWTMKRQADSGAGVAGAFGLREIAFPETFVTLAFFAVVLRVAVLVTALFVAADLACGFEAAFVATVFFVAAFVAVTAFAAVGAFVAVAFCTGAFVVAAEARVGVAKAVFFVALVFVVFAAVFFAGGVLVVAFTMSEILSCFAGPIEIPTTAQTA